VLPLAAGHRHRIIVKSAGSV